MNNLPIPQSRIEVLMNAFISRDSSQISAPQSRIEEFWYHLIEGTNALPIPQSRNELLLKKIIENDTKQIPLAKSRAEEFLVSILTGDTDKLPIPQSRSEYYLDYIARNNLVLDDIEYLKYNGTNITATNTVQKPFRSAILSGSTKYRDVDTGEFLETFEEGRNLELVSVKMPVLTTTGKNLWDDNWSKGLTQTSGNVLTGATYDGFRYNNNLIPVGGISTIYLKHFCPQEGVPQSFRVGQYGKDKEWLNKPLTAVNDGIFNVPSDCEYIRVHIDLRYNGTSNNTSDSIPTMMVVSTSKITDYEPYKSNILTTSEDVVLRGIEGVQETLDCLTGELTHYIGEVTFDGTEEWRNPVVFTNTVRFMSPKLENYKQNSKNVLMSDFPHIYNHNLDEAHCAIDLSGYLFVFIPKTELEDNTVNSAKKYFQRKNAQFQYELAEPNVKTVGLKVVDQDGNLVKQLSAFDETTHIVSSSASDNSLIAIAEVEVPTKLIEALDNIKLLSSDVGMLIDEVDAMQKTQDENSTMTMSAMTELYEIALMMGGNS